MNSDKYTCQECIWRDDCESDYPCEYFSPSDEDIDNIVEKERLTFYDEWNEYIADRG